MKNYSTLGLFALAFCLQLSISSTSSAGAFDTPPLAMQPYENLRLPPQLSRAEVKWILERSVEELDQKAFVDFGDMSDFMHAHVVFKMEPGMKLEKELTNVGWNPPWDQLEAVVALFHTQEYDHVRERRPYRNRAGAVVSSEHRNQLIWLQDSKWTKRGEITSARHFAKPKRAEDFTIRTSDLDERITENFEEYSFYFFRAHCPDVDTHLRKGIIKGEESSVIELKVGGERACVAIVNFHCRNHPEDRKQCAEGNLRPFFTPKGPAKYKN